MSLPRGTHGRRPVGHSGCRTATQRPPAAAVRSGLVWRASAPAQTLRSHTYGGTAQAPLAGALAGGDVGSLRSSLPGDLLGGNGILLDFHVMRHPGEPRHRWPPWVLAGPRTSPIWRARSAPARSGQRRCARIGQIDCPAQLKAPYSTPNVRMSVILCPAGLLWGGRHRPGGALR